MTNAWQQLQHVRLEEEGLELVGVEAETPIQLRVSAADFSPLPPFPSPSPSLSESPSSLPSPSLPPDEGPESALQPRRPQLLCPASEASWPVTEGPGDERDMLRALHVPLRSQQSSSALVAVAAVPTPIPSLDGLRGITALLVMLYHARRNSLVPTAIGNSGPLCVGLFFSLSGFIMTHAYAPCLEHTRFRERPCIVGFWLKRVARIAPSYLFSLLLSASRLVACISPSASCGPMAAVGVALTPLGLQSALPTDNVWDGVAWSISVEVWAYLAFPFRPTRPVANALFGLGSLLVSVTLPVLLLSLTHWGFAVEFLKFNVFARVWEFVTAAAASQHLQAHPFHLRYFPDVWPLLWIVLLCLTAYPSGGGSGAEDSNGTVVTSPDAVLPQRWLLNGGAFSPLHLLIVMALRERHSVCARLLASRPARFLGRISLSAYLIHMHILTLWEFVQQKTRLPDWIALPLFLASTVLVASVMHTHVEKRGHRTIMAWAKTKRILCNCAHAQAATAATATAQQ